MHAALELASPVALEGLRDDFRREEGVLHSRAHLVRCEQRAVHRVCRLCGCLCGRLTLLQLDEAVGLCSAGEARVLPATRCHQRHVAEVEGEEGAGLPELDLGG